MNRTNVSPFENSVAVPSSFPPLVSLENSKKRFGYCHVTNDNYLILHSITFDMNKNTIRSDRFTITSCLHIYRFNTNTLYNSKYLNKKKLWQRWHKKVGKYTMPRSPRSITSFRAPAHRAPRNTGATVATWRKEGY